MADRLLKGLTGSLITRNHLFTCNHFILVLITTFLIVSCAPQQTTTEQQPHFTTRGLVLSVEDLSTLDWPTKAKEAGLTTIATHVTPSQVAAFIQSPKGQAFLKQCNELGLEVEHELHAMNDLVPRDLFTEDSTMFRMNEEGRRVADFNLCVHSEKALATASKNARKYAAILKPTTGRYFYWIDDAKPMCYCDQCSRYSDSEQALILENRLIKELKSIDPDATLAHLAYINTMIAPKKVKPEPGIFLEFAPIQRSWKTSLADTAAKVERADYLSATQTHADILKLLDDNLKVFGKENAQVLEYWLDVSQFSNWKRPAVKLPWNEDVFAKDIDLYAKRGIRKITTFAVYVDSAYINTYGDTRFVQEYGEGLRGFRRSE